MGFDKPTIRRNNVSIENYFKLIDSYYHQVGLDVDIRAIMISLPNSEKLSLLSLLHHWHVHRESFVIKDASFLLGNVNRAAEVTP